MIFIEFCTCFLCKLIGNSNNGIYYLFESAVENTFFRRNHPLSPEETIRFLPKKPFARLYIDSVSRYSFHISFFGC